MAVARSSSDGVAIRYILPVCEQSEARKIGTAPGQSSLFALFVTATCGVIIGVELWYFNHFS